VPTSALTNRKLVGLLDHGEEALGEVVLGRRLVLATCSRKCSMAASVVGVELQAMATSFRSGPMTSSGGDSKKRCGEITSTWPGSAAGG